jgi:hypothetical protein
VSQVGDQGGGAHNLDHTPLATHQLKELEATVCGDEEEEVPGLGEWRPEKEDEPAQVNQVKDQGDRGFVQAPPTRARSCPGTRTVRAQGQAGMGAQEAIG